MRANQQFGRESIAAEKKKNISVEYVPREGILCKFVNKHRNRSTSLKSLYAANAALGGTNSIQSGTVLPITACVTRANVATSSRLLCR